LEEVFYPNLLYYPVFFLFHIMFLYDHKALQYRQQWMYLLPRDQEGVNTNLAGGQFNPVGAGFDVFFGKPGKDIPEVPVPDNPRLFKAVPHGKGGFPAPDLQEQGTVLFDEQPFSRPGVLSAGPGKGGRGSVKIHYPGQGQKEKGQTQDNTKTQEF
jgi:hypothetical protein